MPGVASMRADIEKKRQRVKRFALAGAIDEKESMAEMLALNAELAKLPPDIAPLGEAMRRISGAGEAWERGTPQQKNDLLRDIFASVSLDTREKEAEAIRIEPHPDLAPLFDSRAEYVDLRGSTPGRNRTLAFGSGSRHSVR